MIALSIRQPWAWHILHSGKDIENRDWPTRFRGRVLIHASKGMTRAEYEVGQDPLWASGGPTIELPPFEQLERGGSSAPWRLWIAWRYRLRRGFLGGSVLSCAILSRCRLSRGRGSLVSSRYRIQPCPSMSSDMANSEMGNI